MRPSFLLIIVRSIAFSLLLAVLPASCAKNTTTQLVNESVEEGKSNSVEIYRNLKQDNTTLTEILQKGGLLEQMNNWNGKVLLIKVDETTTPPEFIYYYHNSLYKDKNENQAQDTEDEGFFNPASTVKVGIAALVLEKLHELNLGRETEYRVAGSSRWYRFDEDIQQALVISHNESTNRLILFLGFENLNSNMLSKGLQNFSVNRLMLNQGTLVDSPGFELRFNNQITQQPIIKQPEDSVSSKFPCFEVGQKVGNCASATDLAEVLMRIVQPNLYSPEQVFQLREEDRLWLQQVMSRTPQQEGFNYEDDYCRFLHPLSQKIASKSGEMLSKCGVGLFANTFLDTSFLKTDDGQKYYLVFAVTPPQGTPKSKVLEWINSTTQFLLPQL